jgi:hypothetical protein
MESISFSQCIRHAWHSAWLAIVRMPALLLAIAAIYTSLNLAPQLLAGDGNDPRTVLLRAVITIALSFVTIAVCGTLIVKVHRFVLLDEGTQPVLPAGGAPVRRYMLFTLAMSFVIVLIATVLISLYEISPSGAQALGILLVYPTVVYLLVRLSLLVPAIALGSGFEWKAAWNDSRGHFWSMFGVTVCAYLPLVAVILATALAFVLTAEDRAVTLPVLAVVAVVRGVFTVLWLVLAASTLSWLYRRHAKELPRPVAPVANER